MVARPFSLAKRLFTEGVLNKNFYKTVHRMIKIHGLGKTIRKASNIFRVNGVRGALAAYRLYHSIDSVYKEWIVRYDILSDKDRQAIRHHIEDFSHQPLISVVMPVYDIEETYLRQVIESVLNQLYTNWQFCIADDASPSPHIRKILSEYQEQDPRIEVVFRQENGHISESSNSALEIAKGEFIALLDHDDIIPEHALYHVARVINERPDVDMIYSDEDKINEVGERYGPYFKTDWNPDLFYGQNMFSHLGVYRTSLIREIGGFRKGLEGSQDYDLALRCLAKTTNDKVIHIPHILYHWRAIQGSTALEISSKSYALTASRKAIEEYFEENFDGVKVIDAPGAALQFGYHRVLWPIPENKPLVSIIIPTRDQQSVLQTCLDSIAKHSHYSAFEILVIDNQSQEAETLAYLKEIEQQAHIRVLPYDHPFNYASMNNWAVGQAKGEVIIFLNNDTEVISDDWIEELTANALRDDVGAVGAKLLFEDDRTQHNGIILGGGEDKVAAHAFYLHHKDTPSYISQAILTRTVSAVTGACMAVMKEKFLAVGGFEPTLTVAYNDVDLCLKLKEKGYRTIMNTHVFLYHHESKTRGSDHEEKAGPSERFIAEKNYMLETWSKDLEDDPFYHRSLDLRFSTHHVSLKRPPTIEWQRYLKK